MRRTTNHEVKYVHGPKMSVSVAGADHKGVGETWREPMAPLAAT